SAFRDRKVAHPLEQPVGPFPEPGSPSLRGLACSDSMLGTVELQPKPGGRTRAIMVMAGELDNRWSGLRKRLGREESPDTTSRMDAGRSKDRPLHKRGKLCGLRAAGLGHRAW